MGKNCVAFILPVFKLTLTFTALNIVASNFTAKYFTAKCFTAMRFPVKRFTVRECARKITSGNMLVAAITLMVALGSTTALARDMDSGADKNANRGTDRGVNRETSINIKRVKQPGPDQIIASTHIAASTNLLLAALESPCHVLNWMPDLVVIRALAQDEQPGTRVYMLTRGNFIASPRDAISRFTRHGQFPIIIDMMSEPDALPTEAGIVRIPYARARWSLFAAEDTTLVTYQQQVAAGGNIPQWLADQYSLRHVTRALESLTTYVATLSTSECADTVRAVRTSQP